jgi:tRNA(Ile)-lysidine synthase
LVDKVRRTVAARELFAPGARLVVGCSGGPDSTALVHVLRRLAPELSLELCVASVDHGLRAESRGEVEAVGRFARALGLDFVPLAVTVEGPGIQAAAREARYAALLGLARARGAEGVAVGHTRDDQAETVLARLLRGGGLAGLGGIEPRRADGVVRPLLDCTRAEVMGYVTANALPVVEDPSNLDPRFERVRIRREVLPRLEREDPNLRAHLADLADEARATAAYLAAEADRFLEGRASAAPTDAKKGRASAAPMDAEKGRAGSATNDASTLAAGELLRLPPPLRSAVLRRWVTRRTGAAPARAHLVAIERLVTARGEVLLPRGFDVRREDEALVIRHRPKRRSRSERLIEGSEVPSKGAEPSSRPLLSTDERGNSGPSAGVNGRKSAGSSRN